MIDPEVERRLRDDPTDDPVHVPVRLRTDGSGVERARHGAGRLLRSGRGFLSGVRLVATVVVAIALVGLLVLTRGLRTDEASATPTLGASASTSVAPSAPSGRVIATLQVGDEQYRIELTDPADIEIARRLLRGERAPAIPNGVVVRGNPGVNVGYSWHIDPDSVEFADVTTEVCDGRPSDVEANQITSDHFCPWYAKVIRVEE